MKTLLKITCTIALIGLVSVAGIISGNSSSTAQNAVEDEYAVLTYYPYSKESYIIDRERYSVRILYGNKNVENVKLTKEELASTPMSGAVAGILNRLSKDGYTLVSTSAVSTTLGTSNDISTDTEIHCFLKKVK